MLFVQQPSHRQSILHKEVNMAGPATSLKTTRLCAWSLEEFSIPLPPFFLVSSSPSPLTEDFRF